MVRSTGAGAEIGLAVALIGVALLTVYGTLELPPGSFEPLGSARIPQLVSGAIIVFSLWILATAVARRRGAGSDRPAAPPAPDHRLRPDLAVGLMALAVLYVLVMAMEWARFSIATLVFLFASIGMLTGMARRLIPVVVVLATVFGFGLEYLFTRVFVIDLP